MANVLQFRKHETFYLNGKSHRCYKGVRNKFLTELEKLTTTHNYSETSGAEVNERSWIDTKFIPDTSKDIDIKITFSIPAESATKRTIVIGNWMDNSLGSIGIETDSNQKIRLYIDGANIDQRTPEVYPAETPIIVHYHYDSATPLHTFTVKTLDGSISTDLNITKKNWQLRLETLTMLIGKDNRPLSAYLSSFAGITIYQCEITNGNRHFKFVPYLTRDNKVAMYDVINKHWYYNKGSVNLIAGRQVTEVEYIDISNDGYFDTFFKPNTTTTTVKTRFTPLSLSAGAWVFGSRNSTSINNSTCCLYQASNGYRLDWANGYMNNQTYTCPIVPSLDEPINLEMTRGYAKLNNDVFTFTENTSVDVNYNLVIGRANCGGSLTVSGGASIRLNYFEILNTTSKENYRYFIPAIDENNKGFLFDKVTHTIFDVLGGDITGFGPEIHYIDYLKSTGTQYINTGIYMKQNYGVEINVKQAAPSSGTARYLFGDYTNSSAAYMLGLIPDGVYICDLKQFSNRITTDFSGYDGNFHTHKIINGSYYIDEALQGTVNLSEFTTQGTAWLFGVKNRGAGGSYWQIKKAKVFSDDGSIIKNFIPAMNENLEGMMFDKLWHSLYTNDGTGNFIIGNQIIRE